MTFISLIDQEDFRMKHVDFVPDEHTKYPVHNEYTDPDFTDKYYEVWLDSHVRIRNKRRDGRNTGDERENLFKCRVRRWKFGKADAPKVRFFLISGIAHSCHFFGPLVKCMSIDDAFSERVVEVYALDIPGHGASQNPPNIKFGMLRLEDYVDVIVQVMDIIQTSENVGGFDYVVAHSMGGLLAMLVEESLSSRANSTTLREKYGTKGIILYASALPERIDWAFGEGKRSEYGIPVNILTALLPFVTFSPRYLLHGRIANEDFVNQFFGVAGKNADDETYLNVVPGAPVGDAVSVLNSAESYVALSELAGLDLESGGVLKRPDIEKGLFSDYTLGVAGYAKDFLFLPSEEQALCEYLSTNRRQIYKAIEHDLAVHDDAYSFPCASFQLLAEVVALANT